MFESPDVQNNLSLVNQSVRDQILHVYGGFREINDRADALKRTFRPWRASQYVDAVMAFQERLRLIAEGLQAELLHAGLRNGLSG
jgi:hypothetical protein